MADNSVQIGNLVVRLVADARQLEGELKKAGAHVQDLERQTKQSLQAASQAGERAGRALSGLATRIAALAAAFVSVNAVVGAFQRQITNVTAIDSLSQATGISVERLSELRGIALAAGVSFETLAQAASTFAARMSQGLASSTSQASQAIRALGIEVRDGQGNLRSFDDVLEQVAERFPQYADGANKAAIAAALFGEEAGPRLVALLNRGRAGLEELRRTLGVTVTPADAQRTRDYQRAIVELQTAWERFAQVVTNAVAGPLAQFMRFMSSNVDEIHRSIGAWRTYDGRLTEAARAFDTANAALAELERQLRLIQERTGPRGQEGPANLRREFAALSEQIDRQRAVVDAARTAWAALFQQMSGGSELGRLTRQIAQAVANANPPAQAPALDSFALERAQIALQQLMDRLTGTRSIFDSINLSWDEHSRVVQQAIAQIDRAHDQAHRRQNARYQFERQQQLRNEQVMLQTAQLAAQTITMLWPKSKGAAVAAAIINTSVGITKALAELPPPMSWVQAGLIAAQGAAQVANIRSTNEDGSGGNASQPQAPVAAEGAPMGRSLTISGVDPASIFSGGQVRGLIDQINDEVRNGATLISTGTLPI